ncbi:MAG TPA: S41 family peptidase, partial [Pyrinomonadaceae bacterium]|nr:S41 family peptidase [Pyrinomonadaceae bacterium]
MNRRFGGIAVLILILSTLVGGSFGRQQSLFSLSPKNEGSAIQQIEDDYTAALDVVSANYAGQVNHEKAAQAAIQSMLWSLDPHSTFFPPDEFRKLREDQDSKFYGIGVTIRRYHDGVYVTSTVQNAPAARKGVRYGDLILEVDGQDAREWTSEKVSKQVRGDRGESVVLKVQRPGALAPLYFTVVRDAVPLPSIRTSFMVRPGVGYVGLTGGFQHTTDDELRRAIGELREQGMKQMILDLRGNPGGLLDQAINVGSEFLPRGQVIVSVRGRGQERAIVYKSTGTDPEDFPLVVLIGRNSASASEIVSGAIQDHGRGLIVGETSFGKGLVQRVFLLPFANGLTLTTAKYYTPYGRLIQRSYAGGAHYDYYVRHDAASDLATPNVAAPAPNPNSATASPT